MYTIVSPRVGTPGEPFDPAGHDIDYLLAGGFVKKSAPRATRSAKTEEEESPEE